MAFKEYRNPCKNSEAREFDIERFAYDVFSYMLPICGFPEAKIPATSRVENIYIERDFVMNVGLSVLPIALYTRDDWKCLFEEKYEQNGFCHISDIQLYLKLVLLNQDEIQEEDNLSKVQFSLALYNEFILFCNYKGIEAHFDIFPKLWCQICDQLIAETEDFHQTFESSFIMEPEVSEAWITNFVRNSAIPYGSTPNVSDSFSLYTLEYHPERNKSPDEMLAGDVINVLPDVIAQASNVSDIKLEPSLERDSESELSAWPGKCESPASTEQLQEKNEEKVIVETRTYGRHTNGIAYVLQRCLKGRKRNRSPKLEIEDAFQEISLEKENVSPENRDTKRRRKISGKDELE